MERRQLELDIAPPLPARYRVDRQLADAQKARLRRDRRQRRHLVHRGHQGSAGEPRCFLDPRPRIVCRAGPRDHAADLLEHAIQPPAQQMQLAQDHAIARISVRHTDPLQPPTHLSDLLLVVGTPRGGAVVHPERHAPLRGDGSISFAQPDPMPDLGLTCA